jgi:membrane-associated phospholipid phosphatase
MQKIRSIFSVNRYYFIGYFLFLLAVIFFLLIKTKTDGFIFLNPYHHKILNVFFMIYTNVGDGLFSIAIFLLLLFYRRALIGWEIIITFLLSGLIAQILKNAFPMPRPKTLLGDEHYAYFINGYTHVGHASFPSGHTATAFGLATILSLFAKNKKWSIAYLLLAMLVGYSRIYLGQHFLEDVLAGAIAGVACALTVYILIDKKTSWFKKMKEAENKIQINNN